MNNQTSNSKFPQKIKYLVIKNFVYMRYMLISVSCLMTSYLISQERVEGKIIKNYGATFHVADKEITTDTETDFKVIFDISESPTDKSQINKRIETAARFLNMHAHEGVPSEQLKVAMTIHGGAWQAVLTNETYQEKFGVPNPNAKLIKELNDAGVEIILCGQTASYREISNKIRLPEVKLALSAMTALIQYQNNGYRFIKF